MEQPSASGLIRFKARRGLERLGLSDKQEYIDRLEDELATVEELGFTEYFLIVADILNWCKRNRIQTGLGRGSAAGSLLCFTLGITRIDPIQFGLPFSRFLNKSRMRLGGLPDIDSDISETEREEVIDYIRRKYGQDNVAIIGTRNTMKAKRAVRDAARVLGYSYSDGERIVETLLDPTFGREPSLRESLEQSVELQSLLKSHEQLKQVIDLALWLEDRIRDTSSHPAGIIISDKPLTDIVPIFASKGRPTIQLDMHETERFGLVKLDLLGLTTLSVIRLTLDLIKESKHKVIDIDNIPLDDEATFAALRKADTVGIFQLESSGMRDLLSKMQPRTIHDVIAAVAIYRPGPLGSDGLKQYLMVRAGLAQPEYLTPELEPILSETDGFMIYQEQVMQAAVELAGYTPDEADDLRKAVGKKDAKKMRKHRKTFISAAAKRIGREKATELFDNIESFGEYGFCKAHACSYGITAYQTAWLKTNYPTEYMAALLTLERSNTTKQQLYISEAERMGIKLLPPDINESKQHFSIAGDGAIRFGLSAVRSLGDAGAEEILSIREYGGQFTDPIEFCQRVNLSSINKTKLEALALSGAFDTFGISRAAAVQLVNDAIEFRKKMLSVEKKLETFNKRMERYQQREKERAAGKTKRAPLKKPIPPTMPTMHKLAYYRKIKEMPLDQLLRYEYDYLNHFITMHATSIYERYKFPRSESMTIAQAKALADSGLDSKYVSLLIYLSDVIVKRKKTSVSVILVGEDHTGRMEFFINKSEYKRNKDIIVKGMTLAVLAKIDGEQRPGSIFKVHMPNRLTSVPMPSYGRSASRVNKSNEIVCSSSENLDVHSLSKEGSIVLILTDGTRLRIQYRRVQN